jgi:mannose-6-phosphate isomerase-like protein (cupin superfamily)
MTAFKNIPIRLKTALLIAVFMISGHIIFAQSANTIRPDLQPKTVVLNLDSSSYQEIFEGPPATMGMHSGLVTLKPGETVGHHNTNSYEEMIVVLSGNGEVTFEKGGTLKIKYGVIAYCPPNTEHDVKNTGSVPLKYIYIASKTK